jgi:hypothetical protein
MSRYKQKSQARLGFWREEAAPHLPIPMASSQSNYAIIDCLKSIQERCQREQSPSAHYISYRDFSSCRICGCSNGRAEYTFEYDNVVYVWPAGLIHYLEAHRINPPDGLLDLCQSASYARLAA